MTTPTPAGWYADPEGSGQWRWWDGQQWTGHVSPAAGQEQQQDAPQAAPQQPQPQVAPPQQVAPLPGQADDWQSQQAAKHLGGGAPAPQHAPGTVRSPYTEQRIFVSQKRKIIELTNEYAVFGADGTQIGAVTETGQSGAKKAMRFLTSFDQFMTHTVQVNDSQGRVLLVLTRPAKVFKSTMVVSTADGREIGRLIQRNMFGKIRFGLESGGAEVGSLNAENWRAWNFSLQDHQGTEVARITKKWEGLGTAIFTTADNYLLDIHYQLPEPLHSLVVASALTVDTALKQDASGFN